MRCTKPHATWCLSISMPSLLIHLPAEIQQKVYKFLDFNSFTRILYIDLMITWYQNACLVNNNSSNKTLSMKHDENKIQNICATSNCMHTMCRSVLLCYTTLKRKIQIFINWWKNCVVTYRQWNRICILVYNFRDILNTRFQCSNTFENILSSKKLVIFVWEPENQRSCSDQKPMNVM